jgi:trigger factor
MLHEFEHQVIEAGYKLEDYLRLQGLTPESYQERVRPQAERRVTSRLVLTELMRREKIEVSDEEIQAETARMHSLVGEGEKAQKTHAMFDSETGQVAIQQDLLTKKTLARLREIVTAEPAPEASLETAVVETPAEIAAASEPVEAESGATQPVAEEPAGEPNGNPANNE